MKQSLRLLRSIGSSLALILVVVSFSGLAPATAEEESSPPGGLPERIELPPEKKSSTPVVPANLQDTVSGFYWEVVEETQELLRNAPAATNDDDDLLIETLTARVTSAGEIHTYIYVAEWDDSLVHKLEERGATVEIASEAFQIIQTWVPVDLVEEIANLPHVRRVGLPSYGITGGDRTATNDERILAAGEIMSEGDAVLRTDKVRSELGYTGNGIKIGVISDGVDHHSLAQASGDLSTINVHPTMPGAGDEGTAMLEIIHDLAPDAELYFCSGSNGFPTQLEMVECMNWFVTQGAHIIVDDLYYFFEPYFEDGTVAQGASNVVQQGVVYVSIAGNLNQRHYQGAFNASTQNQGFHNFGTGDVLEIEVNGNFTVALQWSDPSGASANDYDLHIYTKGAGDMWEYEFSSESVQDGNDYPLERIQNSNPTPGTYGLAITRKNGAQDRELELFVYLGGYITDDDRVEGDAIYGHPAIESVITVGTINADNTSIIAPYSSHGFSTIYTNFATQAKTERLSLDGTGVDKVHTKIGGLGYFIDPFTGTSAAAPHIAAVVALMLEADSTLTPAQVSQVLRDTAQDMGTTGYDAIYGEGLFDAYEAVKALSGTSPDVPAAPTNLVATASSKSRINLSWSDNSSDETGFVIERSPGGTSSFSPIHTTSANATSYSDSGLQCGTVYYYRVQATSASGSSDYSNTANATTSSCDADDPGDCNADGRVNAADLPATVLRIASKDFLPNQGCDSNGDASVEASDISCTVLLIFGGTCAEGTAQSAPSSGAGPSLALPESLTVSDEGSVTVPIVLEGSSANVSSLFFSLAYDPEKLRFDPRDSDGDSIPDAVVFSVPGAFNGSVVVDEESSDSTTIGVVIADFSPPLATLENGTIATVTFQAVDPAASVDATMVELDAARPASFGNTRGQRVPPATPQDTSLIYLPMVRK